MDVLQAYVPDADLFGDHAGAGLRKLPVAYDVAGTNWKLSVANNGIGKPAGVFAQAKVGFGTRIGKGARPPTRCPG
jgi:hypothetical protein